MALEVDGESCGVVMTVGAESEVVEVDADVEAGRAEQVDEGFPRSFSPIFGRSRSSGVEYSGKASLNLGCSKFHEWLRAAKDCLCASVDVTDPVVNSSVSIKERSPVNIVATLHVGFQEPG